MSDSPAQTQLLMKKAGGHLGNRLGAERATTATVIKGIYRALTLQVVATNIATWFYQAKFYHSSWGWTKSTTIIVGTQPVPVACLDTLDGLHSSI